MRNEKLFAMKFSDIYAMYVNKVERKNQSQSDLDKLICWMSAYTPEELERYKADDTTLKEFFSSKHDLNDERLKVSGVICGVRIETIEDPLMKEIRIMDKIVDELANGKKIEKIMRTHV
ncbi:DUF2200 domain-containing protein [Erysipelothrix urinaevulpis]|uniref:DUF2200 family protein n=1 Tax=Erysipelothrix urinaevulpis TaxID=2683717 RepID=UPI00135C6D01|nr:DUF2200 family protein [Erysipelothrix urinaevulpis]